MSGIDLRRKKSVISIGDKYRLYTSDINIGDKTVHGLTAILEKLAIRMDAPAMFGRFHMLVFAICVAGAFFLALIVHLLIPDCAAQDIYSALPKHARSNAGRSGRISADKAGHAGVRADDLHAGLPDPYAPSAGFIRVLAVTGWILILSEIVKQLFLYVIVNNGVYDWWYFPFQLCSVPMYLCVLLPAVRDSVRKSFLTFMASYTFVSALAALIYPEDLMRSYVFLTAHGFAWHGILLFISILCILSTCTDLTLKGFARATLLFIFLSAAAAAINAAVDPLMQKAALPHPYAAMFYLNPLHISPQPLVGAVQQRLGIPAGLLLYSCVIILVSGLFCLLFGRLLKRTSAN